MALHYSITQIWMYQSSWKLSSGFDKFLFLSETTQTWRSALSRYNLCLINKLIVYYVSIPFFQLILTEILQRNFLKLLDILLERTKKVFKHATLLQEAHNGFFEHFTAENTNLCFKKIITTMFQKLQCWARSHFTLYAKVLRSFYRHKSTAQSLV